MPVPIKESEFPIYIKSDRLLLAFRSKTDLFKIEQIGSNKGNHGVCIDKYCTRKMVIKYWQYHGFKGQRMTEKAFRDLLQNLFNKYIEVITI